nr:6-phosphogluconate dehydrogenase, decarboxylating [Candidatus Pantoea persica]
MITLRHTEHAPLSPALKKPATPLAACKYIHSPVSGLILHRKKLGAWIRPGEVVAEVVDPVTDFVTPLVAEYGGVLYARHWAKFATAGMLVVRLAGEDEVRSGDLLVG